MTFAELSKFDDKALVHHELQLERELVELSFQHKMSQLDDVSKLKKLRHNIARARTAERAREKEQGLGKNSLRDRHRSSFKASASGPVTDGGAAGFMKGIASKLSGDE